MATCTDQSLPTPPTLPPESLFLLSLVVSLVQDVVSTGLDTLPISFPSGSLGGE